MQLSHHSPSAKSAIAGDLESPTSLVILFAPILQVVSTMRRFVLALYERILADGDASAQMALVTHELLENAVKYNSSDGTQLRISITRHADPTPCNVVEIRTRNRATPAHLHVAEQLVARVRDAADPNLLYLQMMRDAAGKTNGSGLGLARIRAETEMTIDVHVVGDEIEVIARARLPIDLADPIGGAP